MQSCEYFFYSIFIFYILILRFINIHIISYNVKKNSYLVLTFIRTSDIKAFIPFIIRKDIFKTSNN